MMKKYIMFFVVIFLACYTQASDSRFSDANNEYVNGNYKTALKLYNSVYNDCGDSAPLLYNMGNAYYKSGDIGRAVLFLERALWLDPGNADIQKNLDAVRNNTGLMHVETSTIDKYMARFTLNQWAAIATALLCLLAVLFLVRATLPDFFHIRTFKNIIVLITVCVIIALYGIFTQSSNLDRAIVVTETAAVRMSPFDAADQTATLKSGKDVYIIKQYGNYFSIKDLSGTTGWVSSDDVSRIVCSR